MSRHLPHFVVIASEQAHYSILSAVSLLGLAHQTSLPLSSPLSAAPLPSQWESWRRGYAPVACDAQGRMDVEALRRTYCALLAHGLTPFVVCMTAGTTVLGGYDPFGAVAAFRDALRGGAAVVPWLHVDGAWGGSIVMSERHRAPMAGAELADSLVWNPHKMMHVPLQCSALLVREKGSLERNFPHVAEAAYLFHSGAAGLEAHPLQCQIGLKTPQCGRRADALKLWLMWKYRGRDGFARSIDDCYALALYFYRRVCQHPHFLPVTPSPSQCLNVCFWYLSPALRRALPSLPQSFEDVPAECHEELSHTTRSIQSSLRSRGFALTDIAPLPGKPYFLRFIMNNTKATSDDIDQLLIEIESTFSS